MQNKKFTKCWLLLCIAALLPLSDHAQFNRFVSRDAQKAYQNETRQLDGKPGKAYFQNYADYDIQVELFPETRLVRGTEQITYFNNSPDTLRHIVLRMYQDYFQKGACRNVACHPDDLHNGVDLKRFAINGKTEGEKGGAKYYGARGTNRIFILTEPILPGKSAVIDAEWEFTMPLKTKMRMGTYDETTFFVAYWYPQIAVYDDIDGWHLPQFYGAQEFYNDFNDYHVEITVPGKQVVWATGILQNTDKLFTEKYLKRIEKSKQTDEIIHIVGKDDLKETVVTPADKHTWVFEAENVTDFAFATGDHCLWDGTSTKAGIDSDERVWVSAVYREGTKDFHQVADIASKSIHLLSHEIIGVDFPFPKITVFSGGNKGMEFPMMVNDEEFDEYSGTVFVTAHEVAHSYFPFFVGTNESQTAWVDEGLVTYLPKAIEAELVENLDPEALMIKRFERHAGRGFEAPLMTPSYALSSHTYNFQAYNKGANTFFAMKTLLGDDMFKKALQEYIHRWHGKHPTAYDLLFTFEDVAGEDLSWFIKPWFYEFGYPDLALSKVKNTDGKVSIEVEMKGKLPVPLYLSLHFDDGSTETIEKNARIWKEKDTYVIEKSYTKQLIKAELGNRYIPDSFPEDNIKTVDTF